MSQNIKFEFGLGVKVVDETRKAPQDTIGEVYRMEFEKRGIFYAIRGKHGSWLAKEGALTLYRDFKPELKPAMEPGEMA